MIKVLLAAAVTLVLAAPTITKVVPIQTIVAHPYTIEVVTKPSYVGTDGMAKAIIKPSKGFKWNTEYPTTFQIQKTEYTNATPIGKGDIKLNKGAAILCIPYKGEKEGRREIKIVVNFSVCNKEECLVFRNQRLSLSFIVLKKDKTKQRN